VNGAATFHNVTLDTPGDYTLTASDGSLTSVNSNSFTITLVVNKLVFVQQPANVTAGNTMAPIVVDVEDPSGNLISSSNATVTLSVASGPGSLGGTLSVAAVNGVATFNHLSIDTAGDYTINAAGSGALAPAESASFTVAPAAASQIVFTQQPTAVVAGAVVSPIVAQVEDTFGNIVTSDNSNVSLAAPSGSLGGTTTVAAVDGIATFNNVWLDAPGNFALSAAAGAVTATSASVTATPSPTAELVIVNEQTAAGQYGSVVTSVTVALTDGNGNVITTDNAPISVHIVSGPGGGLAQTYSQTPVDGYAQFSNLAFNQAGGYQLKFSDPAAPASMPAISQTVNVTLIPMKFRDWFGSLPLTTTTLSTPTLSRIPIPHQASAKPAAPSAVANNIAPAAFVGARLPQSEAQSAFPLIDNSASLNPLLQNDNS
jgi:hypothetical protein